MKRFAPKLLRAAAVGVMMTASALPSLAQDRTVFFGTVLRPDGTLAPNMAVVVVAGKVESVVAADQAKPGEKDAVVRFEAYEHAVISPGLIDLRSAAGALGETVERKQAVDPGVSALDAVNFADGFFDRALRAGVTSVMIAPTENNIVGGVATTLRTAPAGGRPEVLRADGPMMFALGTGVLDVNRGPTSRSGVLTILRDALGAAAKSTAADDRLAKVIKKDLDALVACESGEDVDAAARTFGEHGVKPNLVLGPDALDAVDDLAGSKIIVVVGPLTFGSSFKALSGPARMDRADLEVAFAGRSPMVEPAGLRVTAALAVRYGMDPAKARQGFTRSAARVAGVAGRVGSLEAGKDADIVVFSNDPLRLDAKVVEVYLKGAKAYTRPSAESDGSWEQ
jgi:imidazolonepropionase-like amidohydrolase